ncbi:MAG: hypothetical protein ACOCRX_00905 [Candidatus Woesearchaeota archaeon]
MRKKMFRLKNEYGYIYLPKQHLAFIISELIMTVPGVLNYKLYIKTIGGDKDRINNSKKYLKIKVKLKTISAFSVESIGKEVKHILQHTLKDKYKINYYKLDIITTSINLKNNLKL